MRKVPVAFGRMVTIRPSHPVSSSTSNRDWSDDNRLENFDEGSLAFVDPAVLIEIMEQMALRSKKAK